MAGRISITASCSISQSRVSKNGEALFTLPAAGIDETLLAMYQQLGINYPKFYKMDNLSKLGFLAAEVLLKDNFQHDEYQPEEVGLLLMNASSSLDADLKYWESAQDIASPKLFVYTLPNIVIGEICIRNNFKGEHAFYISPQFDVELLLQQAGYLFDNSILNACICGWVELIGQEYQAVLYLLERNEAGMPFNEITLNKIYRSV
ncbi:hypothetical protein MUY27_12650 [Mucilaginibacter sp. RS28]|uniref:3-oxoacyl-ACP synthase n=1 Tax=Mucilaginibacter straminoryzae TaxID=2932774 RepID=A0A9X1X531_9SPHI|nr:hypothetical protein [Mucilaginibacter straminoryzae]MCJ8210560.1 hypothetical protein [Mucilaginibacter straminoryzae]